MSNKDELAKNLRDALRRHDEQKAEDEKAAITIAKITNVDDEQAAADVQTLRDAAKEERFDGLSALLSILAED